MSCCEILALLPMYNSVVLVASGVMRWMLTEVSSFSFKRFSDNSETFLVFKLSKNNKPFWSFAILESRAAVPPKLVK